MLRRRGIWLFPYADIKYTSRLQWILYLISGSLGLILGSFALVLLIHHALQGGDLELIPILFSTAGVLWGVLYAPAAIIYFIRRHRGEPTDFFDFEVARPLHPASTKDEDSHAPNHH